ncbi:serine/threonine-protein kinase [Nocardia sp. NPDC005825]|uniref:serine/threonine-protein kinase n=1 Tax=unclassified Nocardia TaxID=2637762 RepID=UPI0033CBC509
MPRVGEVFDGYLIEGFLGSGGMGSVYRARHPRLPRQIALKLLDHGGSPDPEFIRRFEQEADVVARLEHPNIIVVHDRGSTDECLWIAMQCIEGTDASHVKQDEMTVDRALQIIADTASALDYAHSRGVLHRDVKPANILLSAPEPGRPARAVLTDFGIARLLDEGTRLTATSTFTATLAYSSPEQLNADTVDHRSDQYSLACTFFALLTGEPPFAATNPGHIVMAHLTKPAPRLSDRRPDCPPPLDAVLARAMDKDPGGRFASCAEFVAAATAATRTGFRTDPTLFNSSPHGSALPPAHIPALSTPLVAPTPLVYPGPIDGTPITGRDTHHPPDVRHRSGLAIAGVVLGVIACVIAGGLFLTRNLETRNATSATSPVSGIAPSATSPSVGPTTTQPPTSTRPVVAPMDRTEIDRVFASYMNALRDQNMTQFRSATCPQLRATLLGFYLDGQHLVTSWTMLPYDLPDTSGIDNIVTVQATVNYRDAHGTPAGLVTYSWNVNRQDGTYYVCGWLNDPH